MEASPTVRAEAAYPLLARGDVPAGLHVVGALDYSLASGRTLPARLPADLRVDVLDLSDQELTALPRGLAAYELILAGTTLESLPNDLRVRLRLDCSRCDRLESLPDGLTVGSLILRGCNALRALPERLDVWFLDLSGCWAFEGWPRDARIRGGRLRLRGCTALRELPAYVRNVAALDVCDCPNLESLPADLTVTGWLDLGRSGLTTEESLPSGLERAELRWAGVPIDGRIAFHPETLSVEEVLHERNAERRRALLDRYGYGRFLVDARAEVLDADDDPGGRRQLLRVPLPGDEPLVALSCHCPSTGRQYIIRVPPASRSCRHAAAWIAGFDEPDRYRPLIEM